MSPFQTLIRSPHIRQREYPIAPASSNPAWIHPDKIGPIYEMTSNCTIAESRGYWDEQGNTWRKVNGQAVHILGWK
jgi:hypothetical protein